MNSSGNLISLSDSGLGAPSLSISTRFNDSLITNVGDAVAVGGGGGQSGGGGGGGWNDNDGETARNSSGTGLLIDWEDEIQVPLSQAILTQAEVDDTFGVFNRAQQQSCKKAAEEGPQCTESMNPNDEDTAAKLVRSFTSGGRKSDEVARSKKKSNNDASKEVEMDRNMDTGKRKSDDAKPEKEVIGIQDVIVMPGIDSDDSFKSCTSDQPTIIDEDDIFDIDENFPQEDGICDMKMDLEMGRNLSNGSDSLEILDVNNLSSFSFGDGSLDENEYLKNIHKEIRADSSSVTSSIINKIKLEMLQDRAEDKADPPPAPATSFSRIYGDPLSDVSLPTALLETTTSTFRSRLSTASTASSTGVRLRGTRLSSVSSIGNDDDDLNHSICTTVSESTGRNRTRFSNIMGSPIRASYPVAAKYMPTPGGARTPYRGQTARDRLSESLCSPSRTRVFLQTGGAQVSPSRVPVRKSISIETLHYHQSPSRLGVPAAPVKFSTPGARKNRYSFHIEGEPTESPAEAEEKNKTFLAPSNCVDDNAHFNNGNGLPHAEVWSQPRLARLSYSSTSSYGSSVAQNPTTSVMLKKEREISLLSRQMLTTNINETFLNPSSKIRAAREGPTATCNLGVQPLRATAVVPPNALNRVAKPASNPFQIKPKPASSTITTSSGQQRFVPPVAASSPKIAPSPRKTAPSPTRSRAGANQTTPSRNRYSVSARSSGYGPQSLNTTFEAKPPLTSPNRVVAQPAATAAPAAAPKSILKAPAISTKSLKGGLPTLGGSKLIRPATTAVAKSGLPAPKIPGPAQTQTSSFLRRPTTSGSTSSVNKENTARTGGGVRFGLPSRPRPL